MKKESTTFDDLYNKERHRILKQLFTYRLAGELKLYYEFYWDTNNSLDDVVEISSKAEKFTSREIEEIKKTAKEIISLSELEVESTHPLRIRKKDDC